ncbi:MAG: response regulator, partial [Oscillibacter sp.]|nr:response regulator [Oscillibacter sp.]
MDREERAYESAWERALAEAGGGIPDSVSMPDGAEGSSADGGDSGIPEGSSAPDGVEQDAQNVPAPGMSAWERALAEAAQNGYTLDPSQSGGMGDYDPSIQERFGEGCDFGVPEDTGGYESAYERALAEGAGVDFEAGFDEAFAVEEMLPLIEWVAEQMPGGFFIYRANSEKSLMYANTAILRMFGCNSPEEFRELTNMTFPGMVHPDDYEAVRDSIDHQIADESNENLDFVEYRIVRKDGKVRWVNDYGHFVGTPGVGGAHDVFLSDVTEKRLADEENRRRAEVIEGLSVDFQSIFLLDLDGGTMRPYRISTKRFAYLLNSPGNKPAWRVLLPLYGQRYVMEPDREKFLHFISGDTLRKNLEADGSCMLEYRVRYSRTGSEYGSAAVSAGEGAIPDADPDSGNEGIRYMQLSVVRIGDTEKSCHAVLGFRDVTEQVLRVQMEAANRLRMELELEKEKQAYEAKSEFLFNISHDIRTPMNAIVGFTDLARKHLHEPEKLGNYLEKVHESNGHMLSLIDNLLEMSQIDSGHITLKMEPCSLREELEVAVGFLRPQAEEKNISLAFQTDLPEGQVLTDIQRFRRIMMNLISNAIKFTPPDGSVRVTASAGEVSESGYVRCQFQVADTGVGMTEEFMKHIFKAFEREESSTRSGVMGSGLGLSIVKNLLDVMGGSIQVESEKGKGSTFTVSLPVKLVGKGSQDAELVSAYAPKKPGEHRILLVEDIEMNRMLAEMILEEAGFLVEAVPDGTDAVEAISSHPLYYYDLVLMDIQMPVMNGYEATRAIRAMDREDAKKLPIIALSANARDEDRRMS